MESPFRVPVSVDRHSSSIFSFCSIAANNRFRFSILGQRQSHDTKSEPPIFGILARRAREKNGFGHTLMVLWHATRTNVPLACDRLFLLPPHGIPTGKPGLLGGVLVAFANFSTRHLSTGPNARTSGASSCLGSVDSELGKSSHSVKLMLNGNTRRSPHPPHPHCGRLGYGCFRCWFRIYPESEKGFLIRAFRQPRRIPM